MTLAICIRRPKGADDAKPVGSWLATLPSERDQAELPRGGPAPIVHPGRTRLHNDIRGRLRITSFEFTRKPAGAGADYSFIAEGSLPAKGKLYVFLEAHGGRRYALEAGSTSFSIVRTLDGSQKLKAKHLDKLVPIQAE